MSIKRIRGKRRGNNVIDIDDFTLLYEIDSLILNPNKEPSEVAIEALRLNGFTANDFKLNYAEFKRAYKQARERLVCQ